MKRVVQFRKDLTFGKWGEQILVEWIENYFTQKNQIVSYWYDSDYEFRNAAGITKKEGLKSYDLKFGLYDLSVSRITPKRNVRFEIKTDKYRDTGNVCFEIEDNRVSSGIMATSADYFIYFMPLFSKDNIYIMRCEKLRNLLQQDKYKKYYREGGDVKKTKMIVISKTDFNDDFINSGGRLLTWNGYDIPEEFGLTRNDNNVFYESDEFKKYDDDNLFN